MSKSPWSNPPSQKEIDKESENIFEKPKKEMLLDVMRQIKLRMSTVLSQYTFVEIEDFIKDGYVEVKYDSAEYYESALLIEDGVKSIVKYENDYLIRVKAEYELSLKESDEHGYTVMTITTKNK
jgi:hypothetical protein